MNRNEIEFYNNNVPAIRRALERIADALENNNEVAHNVKHAFTGMNGMQVDEEYEAEQARLYTDDIKAQDDAANRAVDRILENSIDNEELDTQHDYLHGLVQDLDNNAYHEFCNAHCLPASDAVAVSNYITDLDYDEVLGIISDLETSNYINSYKSDDQANEDAVTYDDDYDLRCTAKMYNAELASGDMRYKKDCILDYITNEFGSQGARYTDIIKFAYYLSDPNSPKFGYDNRGYYAMGMSGRNPYLVHGGKDCLVKGINKEGDERYFAHSFVESVTDYWKFINK